MAVKELNLQTGALSVKYNKYNTHTRIHAHTCTHTHVHTHTHTEPLTMEMEEPGRTS